MLKQTPRTIRSSVSERGSSLMLMPAAVLVFIILGAFCVDFAAIHLGQRELVAATQGAANDAAASGIAKQDFYSGSGDVRLDTNAAYQAAVESLASNDPAATIVEFDLSAAGDQVTMRTERFVPTIFSKAIPGGSKYVLVKAQATAVLREY